MFVLCSRRCMWARTTAPGNFRRAADGICLNILKYFLKNSISSARLHRDEVAEIRPGWPAALHRRPNAPNAAVPSPPLDRLRAGLSLRSSRRKAADYQHSPVAVWGTKQEKARDLGLARPTEPRRDLHGRDLPPRPQKEGNARFAAK